MASIYLLRHGRAAFGSDDYDRLDPLGVDQARHLGAALADCRLAQPLFVSGGMRRHQETLRACQQALGVPEGADADPRWNEFDHQHIVAAAFPQFGSAAALRNAMQAHADPHAAFQRLFKTAMERWVDGRHDADYAESWTSFRQRVGAALSSVAERLQPGQDAVVSTSAGPIAAVMQLLLSLQDAQALALNWVQVNASYTQLHAGRQLRLGSFNVHAHLLRAGPALVTYR